MSKFSRAMSNAQPEGMSKAQPEGKNKAQPGEMRITA
jgi:hypothetical protein